MIKTNFTNNIPVVGIVGGTGPYASLFFHLEILNQMQKVMNIEKDQDYIPIILDNDPLIPDRSESIVGNLKVLTDLYLSKINKLIAYGANIIVIACNTAHVILENVKLDQNIILIDMIDEVVKFFKYIAPYENSVGLFSTLGTLKSRIYHNKLSVVGVEVMNVQETSAILIHQAIYGIKAGFRYKSDVLRDPDRLNSIYKTHGNSIRTNSVPSPEEIILNEIKKMSKTKVRYLILGCTEISLVINRTKINNILLLDPVKIVANKIINIFQEYK
jgi:aspartate racemase